MREFRKPEHQIIAEALGMMDRDLLFRNQCWFGGGTAIVLKLGEYRLSADVDFLCADADGYRELRTAAVERGTRAFFRAPVEQVRDFQIDQYGLRTIVQLRAQRIKFEIVREARISLSGHFDEGLGVPALIDADMFSEKLLANADRCQDRAVAFRDAIDLGMLVRAYGEIPTEALSKTQAAYGADVARKVAWVTNTLRKPDELRRASEILRMDHDVAAKAISALRREGRRAWPDADIGADVDDTRAV